MLYFIDSPTMHLSSCTPSTSPYISLVAVVCMALKLAYGIGSQPSLGTR